VFRCWLVGLVCALGCGGKARFTPAPGDVWLAAIRVEGNASVDEDDLIPKLALQRTVDTGRPIDPHQLALDTERIRAIYLRRGFFEAKVTARVDARRGAQTAVFEIVEGRRATMEVVIRGLPPEIPEARARELIPVADGGTFDYDAYDDAILPLQLLVERAGYAHVQVEAHVAAERTKARAVAIYEVSPGPRCTFGAYTISGAEGPLRDALVHRIAFREGAAYSPDALAATQRDLYELGRFSTVLVEAQRVPGQTVIPVKITVALGSRHELRGGFGVGLDPSVYEARVRGGVSYVPLADPRWTLAADGRVAATLVRETLDFEPKVRALASVQRLDLFRPRLGGEAAVGYDFLTVEAYTSYGPQLRLGLASPLGVRWLTARLGWAFSYLEFREIDAVIRNSPGALESLALDADQRLGAYQATLVADLRDNPPDPKRGVYIAVRAQVGTPFAGGATTFLQVTPDLRGYLSLGTPRLVLATRVRAGAILSDGERPVTERYYSGGTQGHRGFAERTLSPTLEGPDDEGMSSTVATGGTALLETSAELRLQLGTLWSIPIGAVIFLDGGEVWNDVYDAGLRNLHWAVGGGLSIQLAGVKIRLDVGHRLNLKDPDQPEYGTNTAWHFGVGDSF
jgi:translocation and assembly module TamA